VLKQLGGKVTPEEILGYSRSIHWDGAKFCNLEETKMDIPFRAIPKLLYRQLFQRKNRLPTCEIPLVPFNAEEFLAKTDTIKCVWFGHSALLLRINGLNLLIDPMFGQDAAPIAPFSIKRFNAVSTDLVDDLPEIDILLMSHDHYDHLDMKSIEKLRPKVKKYAVALGVGRHLKQWGISSADITEFDWWEKAVFNNVTITFTPTRHFSGRGIKDRFKGLWGGWVFNNGKENIWFSGDGGYGKHFKEIGEKLGPFDFAFMECGQYNVLWRAIHLFPDECVRAALDAKAKAIMPVHWGSFNLSDHDWKEPVERFVEECEKETIPYLTPRIGEVFIPSKLSENKRWWDEIYRFTFPVHPENPPSRL